MTEPYRCIACGSKDGERASNDSCNWYWRMVEHGKIGPFCRQSHATAFSLSGARPTFTLAEFERLHFLKWRVLCGEVAGVPADSADRRQAL